jgi:small-conductance mechanosensitive channel
MGMLELIGVITTRVLLAFIVFTLGTVFASACKRIVKKVLQRVKANRALALLNWPYNIENIGSVFIFYVVYIITALITLWLLGIASFVIGLILLLLAILVVLSAASFSKDFLPNMYGWYIIKKKGKIKIGSNISILKLVGKVEKISFLETLVRNSQGDLLHVPNGLFVK